MFNALNEPKRGFAGRAFWASSAAVSVLPYSLFIEMTFKVFEVPVGRCRWLQNSVDRHHVEGLSSRHSQTRLTEDQCENESNQYRTKKL